MAKIAICKECHRAYEYLPTTETTGGITYVSVVCPHCGNVKSSSINHIHYGNDGKL